MAFYPPLTLTSLNGFLLMIPLLGMRFGIPALLRKKTLEELDYFPPIHGWERTALWVYYLSNTFLIFSPLLAKIQISGRTALPGWLLYLGGLALLVTSLYQFSRQQGLKHPG